MNEEQRFFDVEFFPEGSNTKEDLTVRATSGLEAIEKIRRTNGQQSLIVSITEVGGQVGTIQPEVALFQSADTTLNFMGANNHVILKLEPNGDIYVNGRLAENDKQVVDGLRAFLSSSTYWRD